MPAVNGVVGIKPTYGRVSRHNAFPLSESLDHIGPMAKKVENVALLLQVIAGKDDTCIDPRQPDRIKVPKLEYYDNPMILENNQAYQRDDNKK